MTFLDAAALSFGPVLAAILAAALILPRTWLALYAAFVVGAIVDAGYGGRHGDEAMGGLLSTLVGMLMMAALAAGLVTRWALKPRSPRPDLIARYFRPRRFSIASQIVPPDRRRRTGRSPGGRSARSR